MTRVESIICIQHTRLLRWGNHYNGLYSVAVTNWNVWRTFCCIALFDSVSRLWPCKYYNWLVLLYIWRFSHVKANWLVLSSRRPEYDPGWVHVRVLMDEVALGRGFSPSNRTFGLILEFISPVLHIHFHLHVARTRTNGRSPGTFTKETLLRKLGSIK